jgi:DNA-binding transcriptional ArsR family regulator
MKLRLLLAKDDKIIYEIPLLADNWPKDSLENELNALETEFDRFSGFFDALSNRTRLLIMKRLFQNEDLTLGFADLMKDLDLNPKTVWESTRKLRQSGLLEKSEEGKYRCHQAGQAEFLMVSLALRRLLQAVEELEEL